MHDAYEPVPILEKLPLQIDCLAAWGKYESGSFLLANYLVFTTFTQFAMGPLLQLDCCTWDALIPLYNRANRLLHS